MPNENSRTSLDANEPARTHSESFPIVGIGASAGGLASFKAFLSGLSPTDEPGVAFVFVQHLTPDRKSCLPELIRHDTTLPIIEIVDGLRVQPNCIYIAPPTFDMALMNGVLQLLTPLLPHGHRSPIDYFFRSLALDQHENAVAIVLSGTGSDGTQGIRAIKAEGGMTMAQLPESAEFDGMPRCAIATGMIDTVLPPAELPKQLTVFLKHAKDLLPRKSKAIGSNYEHALNKIFILLRSQTGHDFSQYKPSTIQRRIERRISVHLIDSIDDYVKYLQNTPTEIEDLFRDLLIGVTSFFRDPESFQELETKAIPQLFTNRFTDRDTIRVWVNGCSTGEEAYSVAILLLEHKEVTKSPHSIQVFATDMDSRAIATARIGRYPTTISADMSIERLNRHFTLEPDGSAYRIRKQIRELLIFSEHDVIKDPPFSRLDLISCRNLMIYLNADLQRKLIPLFHFALRPNGILFLGASEGVGDFGNLFSPLDRKAKLFQRKKDSELVVSKFESTLLSTSIANNITFPKIRQSILSDKVSLRTLIEQALLQHLDLSAALVNAQGDVFYLHGRSGKFLELNTGEASINNILKLARDGLRHELVLALKKSVAGRIPVSSFAILSSDGELSRVKLSVSPLISDSDDATNRMFYLVVFQIISDQIDSSSSMDSSIDGLMETNQVDSRIAELVEELKARDLYVHRAQLELENSNEALSSINEEMQSANEMLESTNEELQTSKEELQSVNEELSTVNVELQAKVVDLSRANNDMNNLLAGTGIATIFVDHALKLMRFTPAACSIVNLIQTDVGRPIAHIASNIVNYDRLVEDAQEVLNTLTPKSFEVLTKEGRWYTMRIQPYRTLDNIIEGAVINFVDITNLKSVQLELEQDKARMHLKSQMLHSIREAVIATDLQGNILFLNDAAYRMYGWKSNEVLGKNILNITPAKHNVELAAEIMSELKSGKNWSGEFEVKHRNGSMFLTKVTNAPIQDDHGQLIGIIGVSTDITERKQLEESLRFANEMARKSIVMRDSRDAMIIQDLSGHMLAWNPAATRLYGWNETEALEMNTRQRIPAPLQDEAMTRIYRLSIADQLQPYLTQRLAKDGRTLDVWVTAIALLNEDDCMYAISTIERVVPAGSDAKP